MKSKLQLLKEMLLEYETEKQKIRQNQERLDRLESLNLPGALQEVGRLSGEAERTARGIKELSQETVRISGELVRNLECGKVKQNQERLDRIEAQLTTEYENEKLKVRQNQQRLDNLERMLPHWQREMDSLFAAVQEGNSSVKRFNFLDKTTNAQSGEDAILAYAVSRLGIPLEKCSYLDLGANRPVEGSNTNFFYTQGSRGVLVEANPELIPALCRERPGDVILNKCVDTEDGREIEFLIMTEDGLSTVDEEEAREVMRINPQIQVKDRVRVEGISINTIMEKYFPEPPVICSIDIEGKNLEILKSVDFERYRPHLLVIEMIPYSNELAVCEKDMELYDYMRSVGYEEYAFTGINSIFIDKKALREKWGYKI